jgi:hypothetical protein
VTVGIGAGGFLGFALEAVPNTYVPPTKFIPIQSESLAYAQETQWRRPIRQTASVLGGVPGDVSIAGDIAMEAFASTLPLLLQAARTTVTKTGIAPDPFVYSFVPTDQAVASKTVSFTVVRNDQVFGYTGCVLSSFNFTVDAGRLMFNMSVVGSDEEAQAAPVPSWDDDVPFGAGSYKLEIPTATQIFDADTFTFTVENNAEPQYRLKDTGRGAQFMKYGENNATLALDRDFHDRVTYEEFKALTDEEISILASNGDDDQILLKMGKSIKSEYTLGLSGQADLLRSSLTYQAVLDDVGLPYSIDVTTLEDIVIA